MLRLFALEVFLNLQAVLVGNVHSAVCTAALLVLQAPAVD